MTPDSKTLRELAELEGLQRQAEYEAYAERVRQQNGREHPDVILKRASDALTKGEDHG